MQTKIERDAIIRWLIRSDLPHVLAIEQACFALPWTEADYEDCLRQRNAIGMVSCLDDKIAGVMCYELHKSKLRLLNFAVHPNFQRQGIGSQMVRRLIAKLSQQRRKEIVLDTRETNMPAQLFFHSLGFKAVGVLRGHYVDTDEDAYVMRFVLPFADDVPVHWTSRLTAFFQD